MRSRLVLFVSASVLALSLPAAAQDRGKGWSIPHCNKVTGTAAVTFTTDEGATLAPLQGQLRVTGYTYGLVALQTANTLDAVYNRTFFRSTSAGCKWDAIAQIPSVSDGFPVTLVASAGDRAFGFSDGRPDLVRLDGTAVAVLRSPVDAIVGFAADAADGNRARVGAGDGTIWETRDGGASWSRIGGIPAGALVYRVAFDPSNMNHVVVGVASDGAYVSFDGGATFDRALGLSSIGKGPVNVFSAVMSQANGNVVSVMGLDLAEADAGAPSQGRHIYRSTDGGLTFVPVVDGSPDVVLQNGPYMTTHPTNADVVYFTYGTSFQGYGTDVYKYDAATGSTTKTHNDNHGVPSIAFNPADPSVMYLGLAHEQVR